MALFEPLFRRFSEAEVRYVVVGGVAAVLHGHIRLTVDLDLIVDFTPAETAKAMRVLQAAGLRPSAPVSLEDFAVPACREAWVRDKGMRVLSLRDWDDPLLVVDIFVEHPIPFEQLWERARLVSLGRTVVRIAGLQDLIHLKRLAGRPQDLLDIEQLERIAERERKP